VGSGQGAGATPFALDRSQTAKYILLIIVICTIAAAVHDVKSSAPDVSQLNVNGQVVRVPQHLRSMGIVLVMGTVALIVNEADAGIGMVLGLGILFLNFSYITGLISSATNYFVPPSTPAGTGVTNNNRIPPPALPGQPGGPTGGAGPVGSTGPGFTTTP
jgi:hypothetical protein